MQKNTFRARMFDKLDDKAISLTMRLMDNRYLHSIRHGFTLVMPIMIIGSIAILINNFPLPHYQNLMQRIWGEHWTNFGELIYAATFSIISLVVCLSISSRLALWYKDNQERGVSPVLTQIISFSCVMVMISINDGKLNLTEMTGVNGLFLSIVITILSSELFIRLYEFSLKHSTTVYNSEATDSVPSAMNAIWPSLATLAVFVIVRILFSMGGVGNINAGMNRLMQLPFEYLRNNAFTAVLFTFATHFLWLFGIHGNNVLDNVAQNLYTTAMEENIAAVAAGTAAPHIFTKTFFDAFVYTGGAGATLCLLIAVLVFGKRRGTRRLAKISVPFGLFNINEPIMYGLPIVLNPVYVIPFLITPIANTITTALAMSWGLVPFTVYETSWTTVIFASGYFATGRSIAAIVLQAFNLAMDICIYAPFVKLADRMENRRFCDTVNKLGEHAERFSPDPGKRLMALSGSVGTVARHLGNDLLSHPDFRFPEGEFFLVYQPIIDTAARRVDGYEALLRWNHPVHGHISPMVAIALAEDTGCIGRLGMWVLDTSLAQLASLRALGFTHLKQYVNISLRQLADAGFARQLDLLLKKHDVPPELLRLEVTESVALALMPEIQDNIEQISSAGIQLALDDFGMGHSSLSYLQVFPSTAIKIDESLTTKVGKPNSPNFNMIKSIVDLCDGMGIDLIAERIETKEQLSALNELGCRLIQGFYFSKPLPADRLLDYIRLMNAETSDRQ